MGIFPNQIHMGQQKAGIKKAKKCRHNLFVIGMLIAQHTINQQSKQKSRNKDAEQITRIAISYAPFVSLENAL